MANKMDRIRCGVIGLGWFGEHHVDAHFIIDERSKERFKL
jgi:hypothetical protein